MALDIQTYRDDYLEHIEQQVPQDGGFQITNDSVADWAVQKIAQAQKRMDGRKAFVEEEVERLRQWQEAEDAKDQQTIDRMTSLLKPYFDQLRESGALGKRKSYRLPHGTLRVRASGPKWRRVDNDALTKWAESKGLVRVKTEVAWSDIGKHLRPESDHIGAPAVFVDPDSGEMVEVPGVALEAPAGESFSVAPEVI